MADASDAIRATTWTVMYRYHVKDAPFTHDSAQYAAIVTRCVDIDVSLSRPRDTVARQAHITESFLRETFAIAFIASYTARLRWFIRPAMLVRFAHLDHYEGHREGHEPCTTTAVASS